MSTTSSPNESSQSSNNSIDSEQYSFIVTWTYFTVYVVIFVAVSIVCAIEARKIYKASKASKAALEVSPDHKPMSKKKAFLYWLKLTWNKKKVYLPLIPHFFDQATDCGVMFEYYRLKDREDLGIDTLDLFYVSIGVIVLHRIVSSVAVYRLTNNAKYIILQIFDLLMIQCIWTNYELDTNEPSNAQRYLQVLEATFESAPQILISTAYLVKAAGVEVNPIVIISLITSFWSLASRVSSDDKVMMRKPWQKMDFKRNKGCPPFKINIRYFLRVILWRFLEISSRVVVLTIVWINLGGLSIFIILAIESIYLGILCYGLGTFDMMGNIVYLRAANSSQQSKKWGLKYTRYFWIYRIVSAYILLILSTIFALRNIERGKDIKYVQDFADRNEQTVGDGVGLGFFCFAWIATPIWQWFGAVIVFDYNNLQSISRDVDQLALDDKWLDVWELIKFGAFYNVQNVLYLLNNSKALTEEDPVYKEISTICLGIISKSKDFKFQDLLFKSVHDNSLGFIKYLFENKDSTKVDVNGKDEAGKTPIFYAKRLRIIQQLVKEECDCNVKDKSGHHALYYMLKIYTDDKHKKFHMPLIKTMIEVGNFDPMMKDKYNKSLLDLAIETKQPFRIKKYLAKLMGVTLNEYDNKNNEEKEEKNNNLDINPMSTDIGRTETVMNVIPNDDENGNIKKNATKVRWLQGSSQYNRPFTEYGMMGCIIVIAIGILLAIDIIILILQQTNNCESTNVKPVDINTFIMSGSIISFCFVCCGICWIFCMVCIDTCCYDYIESEMARFSPAIVLLACFLIWYLIWPIIGIFVYNNMDETDKDCMNTVLSWIILKFCIYLLLCCFCILQVCADWSLWDCFCACFGCDDEEEEEEEEEYDESDDEYSISFDEDAQKYFNQLPDEYAELRDEGIYGGEGGSPFQVKNENITGIRLFSGNYVQAIQFQINGEWANKYGDGETNMTELILDKDEYFIRVFGKSGEFLDYIELFTNKGRSIEAGGSGGTAFKENGSKLIGCSGRSGSWMDQLQFKWENKEELDGEPELEKMRELKIFGGFGGSRFEKRKGIDGICGVRLWSGNHLESIQFKLDNFGWDTKRGTNGGTQSELILEEDEYFNKAEVICDEFVNHLELFTNHGRSISGGNESGGITYTHGGDDYELVSYYGRSGAWVDQLTFKWESIKEEEEEMDNHDEGKEEDIDKEIGNEVESVEKEKEIIDAEDTVNQQNEMNNHDDKKEEEVDDEIGNQVQSDQQTNDVNIEVEESVDTEKESIDAEDMVNQQNEVDM